MKKPTQKEIIEAIKIVVDYSIDDEKKNYEESEEENKENHIYNHLLLLQKYGNSIDPEEMENIAYENKCMAEALSNLGYTQDQISDICTGAPII